MSKGIYIGLGVLQKTGTKTGETVDSEKLGEKGFKKLKAKGLIKDVPKLKATKEATK